MPETRPPDAGRGRPPAPTPRTLSLTVLLSEHDAEMLQYQIEQVSQQQRIALLAIRQGNYNTALAALVGVESAISRMAEIMDRVRPAEPASHPFTQEVGR